MLPSMDVGKVYHIFVEQARGEPRYGCDPSLFHVFQIVSETCYTLNKVEIEQALAMFSRYGMRNMVFDILIFNVIFWSGLHLVSRDPRSLRLLLAGCGLVSYALGWGCSILSSYVSTPTSALMIAHICWILFTAPVPLLVGISIFLLPEGLPNKKTHRVLLSLLLFFVLDLSLLFFPEMWPQHAWILRLAGLAMIVVGIISAVLDAIDEGETLLPDLFRSFDFSIGTALLFGGQVVLVMLLGNGLTFSLLALLLSISATSIAMQTFSKQIATLLDRIAFASFPQIQKARAELRTEASVLTRVDQTLDFAALEETEFTRLVRRALSHFGDLSRLASNPLTYLPVVDQRLKKRGAKDDVLERAIELKALLSESISRLKPQQKGDFGVSDEWRYYNALYFPYIMGIKPYRRLIQNEHFEPIAQKALEWFRTTIPERTLHNWQNAATKLVAQDLREQSKMSM